MERNKEKGLLSAGLPPKIIATTGAGQGQSQQSRRFIWVSHMVAGTQPLGSSSAVFPGAWTMIQIGSGASGIPDGTHVGCWSLRYCAAHWHQWPALTGRVCLHKWQSYFEEWLLISSQEELLCITTWLDSMKAWATGLDSFLKLSKKLKEFGEEPSQNLALHFEHGVVNLYFLVKKVIVMPGLTDCWEGLCRRQRGARREMNLASLLHK